MGWCEQQTGGFRRSGPHGVAGADCGAAPLPRLKVMSRRLPWIALVLGMAALAFSWWLALQYP